MHSTVRVVITFSRMKYSSIALLSDPGLVPLVSISIMNFDLHVVQSARSLETRGASIAK